MSTDKAQSDIYTRLVEAAIHLLAKQGPSEIKARSVSKEAGLSTMGVYNYFGSVPELLHAVANEGFKRQAEYFAKAQISNDPMTNLCAMALACRDFAKRNSHLYDLMFGLSIHGRYSPPHGEVEPTPREYAPAFGMSYSYLYDQCDKLVNSKSIRKCEPALVAAQFWSALHGFIMLELGGHLVNIESPSEAILVPMCINLVVGLGADPKLAEVSAKNASEGWGKLVK